MTELSDRIRLIDALRGLSILLMVVHHALYDAAAFLGAPWWLFSNVVFDYLHLVFAGTFIMLAGVSSRFSRSNVKRGLKTLVCAAVVTAVSWQVSLPIWFGILHLMAFCMLFYGLLRRWLDRVPHWAWVALWATSLYVLDVAPILPGLDIASADWFPPLPWMFIFLLGTSVGAAIRDRKFPQWFYTFDVPVLPVIGRYTLWIYMLHQPVLYGIAQFIRAVAR
ncbi:MAG: DUF1624 domain-containing protein [Oscillospiraceae bacterium]|jgi:uncharacterized membrane protein|nr:DUF1624 domain-containing protein [Oscillospiraceae bacterium]